MFIGTCSVTTAPVFEVNSFESGQLKDVRVTEARRASRCFYVNASFHVRRSRGTLRGTACLDESGHLTLLSGAHGEVQSCEQGSWRGGPLTIVGWNCIYWVQGEGSAGHGPNAPGRPLPHARGLVRFSTWALGVAHQNADVLTCGPRKRRPICSDRGLF